MITDKTLDEALVEILRTKKALEALRRARKTSADKRGMGPAFWLLREQTVEHAAALRASLDLTRKLADLRQGR